MRNNGAENLGIVFDDINARRHLSRPGPLRSAHRHHRPGSPSAPGRFALDRSYNRPLVLKIRSRLKPPVAPPKHPTLDGLLDLLKAQNPSCDEALLRRAHAFSAEKHAGQKRRSGQPYFTHPMAVAYLLAELKFDEVCVAVGLLHDVLEDTLTSREVLEERFGGEIAELVDGVTKIGRHAYVRRDEAQAQTFRKLILASAKDIRVILVKLADRLHNMETLEYVSPETRRRVALETLEIYAPLAHRLGMAKVKGSSRTSPSTTSGRTSSPRSTTRCRRR